MKLLIYGSASPYALESFYEKYLQLEHEVNICSGSDRFHDFYRASIMHKIIFRCGFSTIYQKINDGLMNEIQQYRPDVLLVFKGMELYPETIRSIRKSGVFTVNYNPDHPFEFHGRGTGNRNVVDSIPLYHLHISYSLAIKEKLEQHYHVACEWLPFGYEPVKLEFPSETEEIKRLCFIGYADPQRVEVVKQLTEASIPVDVYGPNWNRFLKPSGSLQIFPAIYNETFNRTAVKYRVQLNLFRPHNEHSHNMRSFEMPGIGSIMLAPDSREHRMFFEDQAELFLFDSTEKIIQLTKAILDLPYCESVAIRQRAREKALQSGYSYPDRAKQITHILSKYLKK